MPPPEIQPAASGATSVPQPHVDDFFGLELTPNELPRRGGGLGVELFPFDYTVPVAAEGRASWIGEQIARAREALARGDLPAAQAGLATLGLVPGNLLSFQRQHATVWQQDVAPLVLEIAQALHRDPGPGRSNRLPFFAPQAKTWLKSWIVLVEIGTDPAGAPVPGTERYWTYRREPLVRGPHPQTTTCNDWSVAMTSDGQPQVTLDPVAVVRELTGELRRDLSYARGELPCYVIHDFVSAGVSVQGVDQRVGEQVPVPLFATVAVEGYALQEVRWRQLSGLPVALHQQGGLWYIEKTPQVVQDGHALEFIVEARNILGRVSSDRVIVTVDNTVNEGPSARIVGPKGAASGTVVTLKGLGQDPNPDDVRRLSYQWEQRSGPAITRQPSPDEAVLMFPVPLVEAPTTARFVLTVRDPQGAEAVAARVFIFEPPNHPPLAHIAGPTRATSGETITLRGIAEDPDAGDSKQLTFEWQALSGPHAGVLVPKGPTLTVTAPAVSQPADLVIGLQVDDGRGGVVEAQHTLTIHPNSAPSVTIEGPLRVQGGQPILLRAKAGDPDPFDRTGLSYAWAWQSDPAIVIGPPARTGAQLRFPVPNRSKETPIVFTVTVRDPSGHTATAQHTVTVLPPRPPRPPSPNEVVAIRDALPFRPATIAKAYTLQRLGPVTWVPNDGDDLIWMIQRALDEPARVPQKAVCLAVDLSGSMTNNLSDVWSRYQRIEVALQAASEKNNLCLVSFVDDRIRVEWSYDAGRTLAEDIVGVRRALRRLICNEMDGGIEYIAEASVLAVRELAKSPPEAVRQVLVLTDESGDIRQGGETMESARAKAAAQQVDLQVLMMTEPTATSCRGYCKPPKALGCGKLWGGFN